ncbi:hypothetical protein Moror_3782 [Moniliophthora roreri MCA 2997]|uniref:Integral membrane protein n=1 Tax=Moniliophthora roreri (strain MCA 2997) TaxID=1381753 RepID=V2WVP4_MONRO|nr:hypothetical protein Moror_3782 [Moniliophthora roreri MCA 2997]
MDTQINYANVMITKASTAVQCFFYGIYTALFTICTHIILKRQQRRYHYLIAIFLLFFLISAHVLLSVVDDAMWYCNLFDCRWQSESLRGRLCTAKFELLIAASAVADAILLWRCYTVWGRRWQIVVLPMILYVGCHVTGFVLDAPQSQAVKEGYKSPSGILIGSLDIAAIVAGAIGINNLVLSSMIAFRISKVSHELESYLGPAARNLYRTVIAVTLESGITYSSFISLLFFIEVHQLRVGYQGEQSLVLDTFIDIGMRTWSSLAGIMSIIIIVRVALGIGFNDIEGTVTSMHATIASDNAPVLDIHASRAERRDSITIFNFQS